MKQFIYHELHCSVNNLMRDTSASLFDKNVNEYSLSQILIDLIEKLLLNCVLTHWNGFCNQNEGFVFNFKTSEETDLFDMIFGDTNGKMASQHVLVEENASTTPERRNSQESISSASHRYGKSDESIMVYDNLSMSLGGRSNRTFNNDNEGDNNNSYGYARDDLKMDFITCSRYDTNKPINYSIKHKCE